MADLMEQIQKEISGLKLKTTRQNVGMVTEIGDGVARIAGLSDVLASEMIEFPFGVFGLALNLEEYNVGAVLLGDFTKIKEGMEVKTTGKVLQTPVGEALIGRVVNALGQPIDGKGAIKTKTSSIKL